MEKKEKPALLVISFGTTHRDTRERTLDVIEKDLREAFAGYEFRRAYTSPRVIARVREREGIVVDSVEEAIKKLWREGYGTVLAQSTHVIRGFEYDRLKETLDRYRDRFESLVLGEPLLTEEKDYQEAARILGQELERYRRPGRALVLMGHGTEHRANDSYAHLQEAFFQEGYPDYLVGTIEESPTLETMKELVERQGPRQVVLAPFLVVAGEHVCHDMAGDQEDSWKSRFLKRGCEVECLFKGLGEYEGIRRMYIRHGKQAEKELSEIPMGCPLPGNHRENLVVSKVLGKQIPG